MESIGLGRFVVVVAWSTKGAKKIMAKKKTKTKAPRVRGFLVAHAFTPYKFSTRITPPYFETSIADLAEAIEKAKGTQELTPAKMLEYKKALKVVAGSRSAAAELAAQARAAKAAAAEELAKTKAAEAEANTEAAAAVELAAAVGIGDGDLFEELDELPDPGITSEDLEEMTDAELLGVLETFGIEPPRKKTRPILLQISEQAIAGKLKAPASAE